jgi:penicillin-binding protein 2
MQGAIKNSCNIYFYNLAQELGIDKITNMAQRFGYGESFDIDLQEVRSAPLPSDDWKRKALKTPWVGGDTLNSAIGQGFMLASPIQIAVATARMANGGIPINPYLVKDKKYYEQYNNLKDKPIVSEKHLNYVKKGMYRVVNEAKGTAFGSRIRDKSFEMSGKTGTSQVISKREKDMTPEELKKNQNHAIFTAFAPSDKPRYAISVVVEHGGSGSRAAAPLAKKILEEVKKLSTNSQL